MEEFPGLFICTTNLLEKLDTASLRRFDWKIAFKAMTASQRWAFFLQEFAGWPTATCRCRPDPHIHR